MLHTDDRLEAGRRQLLFGLLALGALSMAGTAVSRSMAVQAWKDPSCGCCEDWIAHLEMHGFTATAYDQRNDAARVRARLPSKFASCHTALVQGYAIKGHVPAADIQRLL